MPLSIACMSSIGFEFASPRKKEQYANTKTSLMAASCQSIITSWTRTSSETGSELKRQVGLFADGAAVRMTGDETFRVAKQYVDGMLTVTTDEICQVFLFYSTRRSNDVQYTK